MTVRRHLTRESHMFWFIYLLIFLIGLAQTPLLVDLLRLIFPAWRIKRLTSNVSVYLLRVLMTTFFLTGLGQHVYVFVPLMPDVPFRTVKLTLHCIFAYWVWFNMTVNYYLATFLSPGYCANEVQLEPESVATTSVVDSRSKGDGGNLEEEHSSSLSRVNHRSQPHPRTDIPTNENELPLKQSLEASLSNRSHYCKICQKTVLHMDHHCPFTGNCVGLHNYSHFLLSVVYAWMGLGYGIFTSLFYFGECIFPAIWTHLNFVYLKNEHDERGVCSVLELYREYMFPVIGGFAVLSVLLAFQGFLLLSDMTTYDVLKNFWKQPVFKLGLERIRQCRYKDKESRLNVLLLHQRPSVLNFALPIRN